MNSLKLHLSLAVCLTLLQAGWSQAADGSAVSTGSSLYHDFCSVCHGDKGNGDSHARQGLKPPPKDFTSTEVQNALNRESMFSAVKYGKPGTAMVAWSSRLDDEAIYAIVDFVMAEFMPTEKEITKTRGYDIYHGSCSVCHGDDGAAAKWAGSSLKPPPRNFTSAQSRSTLTKENIVLAVREGRAGTAMTSFRRQLSDEDINAVADYISSTFLSPTDK